MPAVRWAGLGGAASVALVLSACQASSLGGAEVHHDAAAHADAADPKSGPTSLGADGGLEIDGGAWDARPANGQAGRDASTRDVATRPTAAVCPDGDQAVLPPAAPVPARVPTALPTTCNPLGRSLIFPASPPGSPGLFARCASFSLGATNVLALSPDGRRAAMVNGDGVARIVDLGSQQVIALLAPPRARVSRVAFSPDGDAVLTVAGGEHEVTLYSTSTWTPRWTVTLPGPLYGYVDGLGGAATFSPDGLSVVVSPGGNLYLLDTATGALRASYTSLAILDAAYARGGERLVAIDGLTGSCFESSGAARIVALDPNTLDSPVVVTSWSGDRGDDVTPAFRASPTDDVVLVPASSLDPDQTIRAFRLSDGGQLPRLTMTSLPAAFLPDGDMLIADGSELRTVRLSDGATTAMAAAPTTARSVFAVSADGSTVAVGGDGADLLRAWTVSQSYALGVCTVEGSVPGPEMALSGDGRLAALVVGPNVEVLRPEDGGLVATATGNGDGISKIALSRTGRYVAMQLQPAPNMPFTLAVVAAATDGLVANLARQGGFWYGFLFSPDERFLYTIWFPDGPSAGQLEKVDLSTGQITAARPVASGTYLVGVSRGCPVLLNQMTGVYRSCDSCDELPVPASSAVVSPDGDFLATADLYPARTVTVRQLSGGGLLQAFGPPSDGADFQELVDGLGPRGAEVLLGTGITSFCFAGSRFQSELRDVATAAVLAQLPPTVSSLDDGLTRVAYGTELWCRQ